MKINHHLRTLRADIIGELDGDVRLALFRGIPYASVEKRWTHSRTMHYLPSPFDATEYGPRCVQGEGPVLVSGGVTDPVPGDDEFKCLNLNITVPKESLPLGEEGSVRNLLPVMVWIHGGAFNYGANSVARYRPQVLSSLAKQFGTPIVLVQIGYRLGPLGFAASEDLASEDSDSLSTDYDHANGVPLPSTGNYGLVDQRNALEWVRDHIRDFGGDPLNVTAFGVSAGSASIHYHILTGTPLFDRAIMMSGSAPTIGPLPFKLYEVEWQKLCAKTGTQGEESEKRLEKLRSLSPEQIIGNYSTAAMGPMADGILLPPSWNLGEQLPPSRCKSIILGDTRVEGIIFDSLCKRLPQPRLFELVESSFPAANAKAFCYHFGFKSQTMAYEAYRDAMRLFLSVAMFQIPNFGVAESYGRHAYLYHFEEPSPYPGPTFGIPYHGQCALFMYNNESHKYSTAAKRTAVELARAWTAFAYAREPWEPYSKSQRFMRFGPGGDAEMRGVKDDDIREYGSLDWCRSHWDEVMSFAQNLLNKS